MHACTRVRPKAASSTSSPALGPVPAGQPPRRCGTSRRLALAGVALVSVGPLAAVEFEFAGINALVPDGKGTGLADVRSLDAAAIPGMITGLTVTLQIGGAGPGGAFNGDLYATLQHGSGFAVLLNRPGRTVTEIWGYDDNGFAVIFDDTPGTPDIHAYRVTLGGSPPGALGGIWSADARTADPAVVVDVSPREAGLESFLGLEAAGNWTLFLADLEPGGQARLEAWGLDITTTIVPEPRGLAWGVAVAWAAGAVRRRRRDTAG